MYGEMLRYLSSRPGVYEPGEEKFWNDEHISKSMLKAHLDENSDPATRNIGFVRRSADWIAKTADPASRPRLLDLGCGPGIYAELFAKKGFCVTGVDFSPRSIAYARKSAAEKSLLIDYRLKNYLDMDFCGEYDVATLIYCDFGVLNSRDRKALLNSVRRALAPGGLFILDVCSQAQYSDRPESTDWTFEDGGFWSERPYACLYSFLRYDECRTYCERYVVVEEDRVRCFNIWNHAFTGEELTDDLLSAGFSRVNLYGDLAGAQCSETSKTICAAAHV